MAHCVQQKTKMLKNFSKQSDYDNRYQLLNGKVIQKTLTSHYFLNKFIFSFHQKFTGEFEVKIIPEIIYQIVIDV